MSTVSLVGIRVCIDVDDMDRGVAFYVDGLGLTVGRRFDGKFVELLGAGSPIDLLENPATTKPVPNDTTTTRTYTRHWTPVHLDFVVDDIDAAVARAVAAGATIENAIRTAPYGRIATLADPFGHGFDLLEMNERGYDALVK